MQQIQINVYLCDKTNLTRVYKQDVPLINQEQEFKK